MNAQIDTINEKKKIIQCLDEFNKFNFILKSDYKKATLK